MVSPFTLAGPQFLAFYAAIAAVLLLAYGLWLRSAGPPRASAAEGSALAALTADPYRIACLRAGPEETVRVAVVNLIDRGLLTATKGRRLRAGLDAAAPAQRRPLDAAILARCGAAPLLPQEIGEDRTVRQAAASLERDLQDRGLLVSPAQRRVQGHVRFAVVAVLSGLAIARVVQALTAGRTNVGYLAALAVLACVVAWRLPRGRLTAAGRAALASVRSLTGRLRQRSRQLAAGGATEEALLFAALFGIHALPAGAFAFVDRVYPRPSPSSDTGGGGGTAGDGGGGSSGSGDGGGGGGGGGCGGCGGGGGCGGDD